MLNPFWCGKYTDKEKTEADAEVIRSGQAKFCVGVCVQKAEINAKSDNSEGEQQIPADK